MKQCSYNSQGWWWYSNVQQLAHIEKWTWLATFGWQHIQMHSLELKLLYFDLNFTFYLFRRIQLTIGTCQRLQSRALSLDVDSKQWLYLFLNQYWLRCLSSTKPFLEQMLVEDTLTAYVATRLGRFKCVISHIWFNFCPQSMQPQLKVRVENAWTSM